MKELTSINEFLNFKNKIKDITEQQVVSHNNYVLANTNVATMLINNTDDAFLYFASLNLLNAYVKQNKKEASYSFKSCITPAFDKIIEKGINASFYYDEQEKLLIVNICNFQFSFHNVNPSIKMNFVKNNADLLKTTYHIPQNWEGIRLQMVAEELFNFASNLKGLTNKSIVGNLKKYHKECIKSLN